MRYFLGFIVSVFVLSLFLLAWPVHAQQLNVSVTPTTSGASAVSGYVFKASPGRVYQITATNATSSAGYFMVLNAIAVPGQGSVTPILCRNLPASGSAVIDFIPTPSAQFTTGVVGIVSSGANCGTYTTGTITAYFDGIIQ